jgi:hypothetical protein
LVVGGWVQQEGMEMEAWVEGKGGAAKVKAVVAGKEAVEEERMVEEAAAEEAGGICSR